MCIKGLYTYCIVLQITGDTYMEINILSSYSDFLGILEYPAVVFCDDGEVLSINNAAMRIIGSEVSRLSMEPDKFMVSDEFWPTLEQKKAIIWHRLALIVNGSTKYIVSGFIDQFEYGDKKAYMVLFELRSDVTIGSVSLERIVNHIGVVAMYLYKPEGVWTTRYISKNISDYGYKDGNFYSGHVGLSDIMPKNDYDMLIGQLYKANTTGVDDFEMEARIVSATRDISRMNLKCHLVRTSERDVDGIELLFIKEKETGYEENQIGYILSAMTKIKSFVLVDQFVDGKPIFKYITPTAKHMGLNVDAIRLGDKLAEDYIHPKDRSRVVSSLHNTMKKNDEDYEVEFRLVNDRGEIIWVKSQSSITQADDNTFTVEHFISDITDKKFLESSVEKAKKEFDDKLSYIMKNNAQSEEEKNHIDSVKWSLIINSFAVLTGLYSTIIDPLGNKLVEPVGPQKNMGSFYDMFEKPQYKQIYMKLNEVILRNNVPVIMDMDDNIDGSKICGAPILIDGKHVATWICCAYEAEETKKLESIYKVHWQLGKIFSEYAFNSNILEKEARRAKSIEILMETKVMWQRILVESMSNSDKSPQQVVNDLIYQVGESLNADVAAVYLRNDTGGLDCMYVWSKNQSMSAEEYVSDWQRANTKFKLAVGGQNGHKYRETGYLVVDAEHMDDRSKKILSEGSVKSFVAVPVYVNGENGAVFVLANTSMSKIWSMDEIEFAKQTSDVIRCFLEKLESDDSARNISSMMLDSYNYMDEALFIRESETGRVLFSNKALNDMLGYDFTDKDSKLLIENLHDKYKLMGGPGSHIESMKKEVNWRSYIRALDKIMDLTEVGMKWLDGSKASLVILRDVSE